MCGIAGFITPKNSNAEALTATCRTMTAAMVHRGPDSEGHWIDANLGIALGHRRLSIQDLSASGHQPMVSRCGRFVITFNGEIYNHTDLRLQLAHRNLEWRGHSDTETLVEAISAWGLKRTLGHCTGMFAMAVWDRQDMTLSMARDRFGEKPLYYLANQHGLMFASELRAIEAHPDFQPRISLTALACYFRQGYIPGPLSIYEGVCKLPPGSCVTYSSKEGRLSTSDAYWSIDDIPTESSTSERSTDAASLIEPLFRDAVARQMIGDVPLGAFLSGGIDSSLVVAMMQELSATPIHTFTIGFEQDTYDEAVQARHIAAHLGTHHTELYVTEQNLLALIPSVADVYDEPFADASQVPTILLCQLARRHVTVALSGDGADELFGGYRRHTDGPALLAMTETLPSALRKGLGDALTALPASWFDRLPLGLSDLAEKSSKVAAMLKAADEDTLYEHLTAHRWPYGSPMSERSLLASASIHPQTADPNAQSTARRMMRRDVMTYLPDDIMVKVDRAAMSTSLETRAPFLDHILAEAAWRLPLKDLVHRRRGKLVLRDMLAKRVPSHLMSASKRGFTPPVGAWLKGPLRSWGEHLLNPSQLRTQGLLDPAVTQRMWQEHQSGRKNWTYQLWDVLMFQAWLMQPGRQVVLQ
jgi:asparagine synthase (glutamine-hydrolysing)